MAETESAVFIRTTQLGFWKRLLWRWPVVVIAIVIPLLSEIASIWDEFIATPRPRIIELLNARLHWYGIVIIGLVVLIGIIGVEAYGAISATESKLEDAIARIKRTSDYVKLDWGGEWREMEAKFKELANTNVYAMCSLSGQGTERWDISSDYDDEAVSVRTCRALCDPAGSKLSASLPPINLPLAVTNEKEYWVRWVCFLRGKYNYTNPVLIEYIEDGKTHRRDGGYIHKLASVSAIACIDCAASTYRK